MEQITRGGMLITHDGSGRLEIANAVQAQTTQDATDGRPAQTGNLGDMEAGEALAPQLFHVLRHRFSGPTRRTMRTRRTILQTGQSFLLITTRPLGCGWRANTESKRCGLKRCLVNQDLLDQLLSTDEGKSCILSFQLN